MAQIVGLHSGTDQVKNNNIRPPLLTIPPAAYPNGKIVKPANAAYAQQSVQVIDSLGNGAAYVRIADGGYRTVQRVINVPLNGDAVHNVRLLNNVGPGLLYFSRIDGVGSPTGFLKLLDDRDRTSVFILSGGMGIVVNPNMHRLVVQGSGCDANSYAVMEYAMGVYMANVVFDALPGVGELISFGDFAVFETCAVGGTVAAPKIAVEIPASLNISDFCDNLVTAFNTAYVAAIEPAASQTPYHWAGKLTADDLIYYKDSTLDSWELATDRGVQFNSIDAAMIRNIAISIAEPDAQIIKQL